MQYVEEGSGILLTEPLFDLSQTLDCGQAFRWSKADDGSWYGYALDDYLELEQTPRGILFRDTSEERFLDRWVDYFDLNTDYERLKSEFSSTDETLRKACEFAGGIRLLRQDAWECLISFILSQNNNIPRIKLIVSRLCDRYGGFPTPEALEGETVESLAYLRAGFRAKYLVDAIQRVCSGKTDLLSISKMELLDAKAALMEVKGVGNKVSDCVLLFGMYRTEAFPVDVWIKRVLQQYYPDGFPESLYRYRGIAQQYLFHYVRSLERGEL